MKTILNALRQILTSVQAKIDAFRKPQQEQLRQVAADLEISGNGMGFYSIAGVTEAGQEWVCSLVDGADPNGLAYTDTSNFARDIADGALADGLSVSVNGREYRNAEGCA
jgi:hypothetical protein